ncbi:MAG: acetyl-CoA carboxylase biotin carboxylase subunit [Bacillota bacterium]|jgi:acetyl-CoA carboxylase biotin carboxylase subunit
MFKKILVANRGEIAVRIIRAASELGIGTVAIYSEADKEALHVKLADEAYCVGGPLPQDSYLHLPNIMSIATLIGVDAIHPGYGFLAENAAFAELCAVCSVKFIGPSAEAIKQLGDKTAARKIFQQANIPIIPGTSTVFTDVEEARQVLAKIGYPVMLKAAAGGGGKGMRVVWSEAELADHFLLAGREAVASFGYGGLYAEKFLVEPRHVEVQVLADQYGNVVHLGERDCSLQRRYQKLIEEAPSPAVSEELRERMGTAAIRAVRATKYAGVGTVEFLLDKEGSFYFMEMNTRIQVEHPVTEELTGIDLIKEQIKVAVGERLALTQQEVKFSGWAMECRINAECAEKNFTPSPGEITFYLPPGGPGVRVDSACYQGCKISPYYDSLIAKLIAHGSTRQEVLARMRRALSEFAIYGIETTIPFQLQLVNNAKFIAGDVHIQFLEKELLEV